MAIQYRGPMLQASASQPFIAIFLDPATWAVTGRSLLVSMVATLFAMTLGLLLARMLLDGRSRIARFFDALLSAFVAIPAVVIGLLALLLFSSALFTDTQITLTLLPMMAAQSALLLPLATTLSLQVLRQRNGQIGEELRALGTQPGQAFDALLRDTWPTLAATAVLVFSRGIAEVGTVLIIGGNVAGHTQVLTTLIAEQARNGIYEQAVALALILILIALGLSLTVRHLQHRGAERGTA